MQWKYIVKYRYTIIITIIFLFHVFFSFYELEKRAIFNQDQVNNAWAAFRILVEGKLQLLGPESKGNSGMFVGPLYYYFISIFYFFTNLDPIASPIAAACTSIFSFFVLFFVSKRLFNQKVACVSCFIYTFCYSIIQFERIQWTVNFVASFSLLVFYFLYRVIQGEPKYLVPLGFMTGLSFHIHHTSIFYPIIIFFSLPFFPWKKRVFPYIGIGVALFSICSIPQIIYYVQRTNTVGNYSTYFQSYYHGFHLTRFFQLSYDALIEFFSILELPYPFLRRWIYIYIPLFFFIYIRKQTFKKAFPFMYLISLWIVVPWVIFSMYSGEITNYYFSTHLYIAVVIFAYLTVWVLEYKYIYPKLLIVIFWLYFTIANVRVFFNTGWGSLIPNKNVVRHAVENGESFPFDSGDPKYYLYYVFYEKKISLR